jgi:hypothetical protein
LPNALLSRWPIAFVSGPRTAFWRADYWSFAPRYLAEHGYDVTAVDLPWQGAQSREAALRAALDRMPHRCHLIFDAASRDLARAAASWSHANAASLTVVASVARRAPGYFTMGRFMPGLFAAMRFAQTRRGRQRRDAPSAEALRPLINAIYELPISLPRPRQATFAGRLARAALAAHRATLAARDPRSPRPLAEEIAAFDESLGVESQILAHAISLAERDAQ